MRTEFKYNIGDLVTCLINQNDDYVPVIGTIIDRNYSTLINTNSYKIEWADGHSDWYAAYQVNGFVDCFKDRFAA